MFTIMLMGLACCGTTIGNHLWSNILDIVLPLLKKGDYIEGSFVKSAHCNGFINDGNPGDRTDKIGRFPFSIHNAKEAVQFANAAQINWQERASRADCRACTAILGSWRAVYPISRMSLPGK